MIPPLYIPILPADDKLRMAVWGEVVVGGPWDIYGAYGDGAMLQEHFPQARAWIDHGTPRNDIGLWDRSTFQSVDWLDPEAPQRPRLLEP